MALCCEIDKSDVNSHPHSDFRDRLALVHNGTIENYDELRRELEETHHIPFRSNTDSEVIVQMIGRYLDEDLPLIDAVTNTLGRLHGTWGICLIAKDSPNQIIAARNGSPLSIGIGAHRMFVASETTAFERYTKQFITLKDGEVVVLRSDGMCVCVCDVCHKPCVD